MLFVVCVEEFEIFVVEIEVDVCVLKFVCECIMICWCDIVKMIVMGIEEGVLICRVG